MKINIDELKEIGKIQITKGNIQVDLTAEGTTLLDLSINEKTNEVNNEGVEETNEVNNAGVEEKFGHIEKIKKLMDRTEKLFPPKKRVKNSLDIKNELERRLQYVQEELSTLELDKLTIATAYSNLTKISNEIEIINGIAKEFYNSWYSEMSKKFDNTIKKEIDDFLNVDLKECKNIEDNKEKIQEETNNNA